MKFIKISFILALTIVLMASCLGSGESTTTLYSDAVITNITLGKLNKYVDGTQTTYDASSYDFSIDQSNANTHTFKDMIVVGRCAFNNDSLPLGTDLAHVLCTISTLNNGIAVLERLDEANVYDYVTSSDSIDFTKPRKFRVFSSDAETFNDYYISIDAHQEDGNKFVWRLMQEGWTAVPDAPQLPAGIKQLLGSSTTEQYALSTDNKLMVSRDKGVTWAEEVVTEDADKLPTRDLSLISYPMPKVDSVDYVLLIGNREVTAENDEAIAMVWRKVVDYSKNAPKARWSYMERNASSDEFSLPRLKNLTMVKYDDGILAIGGEGIGGCDEAPYGNIYKSRDNGITWKFNSQYQFPEGFDNITPTKIRMTVDDDNFIWLYCENLGEVWRGRLNKLGWEKK